MCPWIKEALQVCAPRSSPSLALFRDTPSVSTSISSTVSVSCLTTSQAQKVRPLPFPSFLFSPHPIIANENVRQTYHKDSSAKSRHSFECSRSPRVRGLERPQCDLTVRERIESVRKPHCPERAEVMGYSSPSTDRDSSCACAEHEGARN